MFSVPSSVICQMLLHYSTFPLYFQISPLLKRKLSCPYFSLLRQKTCHCISIDVKHGLTKIAFWLTLNFRAKTEIYELNSHAQKMSEFVITLRDRKNSFLHPLKNFSFSRLKSLPGIS